MPFRRRVAGPVLFATIALGLAGALVFTLGMRRAVLPDELRYVPRHSLGFMALGSIRSVWEAVDHHFGDAIRDEERKGFLASTFQELQEELADQGLETSTLSDLTKRGIDVERGLLYAGASEEDFIFVVPTVARLRFLHAISRAKSQRPQRTKCEVEGYPVFSPWSFDESELVVRANASTMLLSSSCAMLAQALFQQEANLAHARDNDVIYETVRYGLRRALMSGPSLFAFARLNQVPSLGNAALAINLDPQRIRIQGDVTLLGRGTRLAQDLLSRPPPWRSWSSVIDPNAPLLVAVRDRNLRRYLRLLGTLDTLGDAFGEVLPAALDEESTTQAALVLLDYREGIPRVVLGLWGSPSRLRALVGDVRREMRVRRDLEILQRARTKFAREHAPATPSVEGLAASGLLADEPLEQFERVDAGTLTAEHLEGPSYATLYKGVRIDYLAPPVLQNDVRYRLLEKWERLDIDAFAYDRYRLAAMSLDNALWVAVDAGDLLTLIDHHLGDSSTQVAADLAPGFSPTPVSKMSLFLNVGAMVRKGLLTPESEISEGVTYGLLDLEQHPHIQLQLVGDTRTGHVRLYGEALRAPDL